MDDKYKEELKKVELALNVDITNEEAITIGVKMDGAPLQIITALVMAMEKESVLRFVITTAAEYYNDKNAQ